MFSLEEALLEQILRSGPESELLVDLDVQFGPLTLQFPPAGGGPGVTALARRLSEGVTVNRDSKRISKS